MAVAALLPSVQFLLVWRRHHLAKIQHVVASAGVNNVKIRSGMIKDMAAVYQDVHAAILPGLEHRSFIPCPRSGLEALAHGKPLLLSNLVSLAPSVDHAGAGLAFDPSVAGLKAAITQLMADYPSYQSNTQRYIQQHFSPSVHLERYRRIYQAIG
jgi:glycosyltransferase involved in cell wall biosynthesis